MTEEGGMVLATALEVNGERAVFLPTGYFRAFAEAMRPFVGDTEVPPVTTLLKG